MKESKIQSYILQKLKKEGIFSFKIIATNKKGIPDIFFLYQGLAYFIEVKTIKGKLSDLQKYQITGISDSGGRVKVIRSTEEFDNFLDCLLNEINGN